MSESFEAQVLLFAGLRQRAGTERVAVRLAAGATVDRLLEALGEAHPELGTELKSCRVALDQAFAAGGDRVPPGAEIAIIPPVSGGHDGPDRIRVSGHPLSLEAVIRVVEHEGAGGLTTFTGNVRRASRGKTVERLEYEAYEPMAVRVMTTIADGIEAEIEGARVAIHHRVGTLAVGETAVVIAASAPHRDEAFRACRAAIERLKQDVPIWKKEVATDGEAWIGQGP